jgi:hypothetical protein
MTKGVSKSLTRSGGVVNDPSLWPFSLGIRQFRARHRHP